ncbi:MAG TPA: hypothetical protein VK468_09400 [Pyrinomonadaceae bacterium]|nr:hypothetical protein [Pyrinomonadaceae bacterium]
MKFIKFILAMLGLFFGIMIILWVVGLLSSLLWYGIWIGLIAAVGYGGYKMFRKAEDKYVGAGSASGYIEDRDYNTSWEEYERKYLQK